LALDNRQASDTPSWFVLWTQSHCERLVTDQLAAKGFEVFLPTIRTWSRQRGARKMISLPMFPGYSFIRHAVDRYSYVEILKTRGVVRILGDGWERLAPVPDHDVETIQRIVETDVPVFPHTYLCEGQRVRIVDGPLRGVEGVLVQAKPSKGLLVISVELLRRSVAVEVDGTQVIPSVPVWQTFRPASTPAGASQLLAAHHS
jgi:transcription termination/antitermination protein NusG